MTPIVAKDIHGEYHHLQTTYPAEVVTNNNTPLLRMLSAYTGTQIVAVAAI